MQLIALIFRCVYIYISLYICVHIYIYVQMFIGGQISARSEIQSGKGAKVWASIVNDILKGGIGEVLHVKVSG